MTDNSGFTLLFRKELSCSGTASEGGVLAAFTNTADTQWALFWLSDENNKSLHLGYFCSEASMEKQVARFIQSPETTPGLALESDEAHRLRNTWQPEQLPNFTGVFGTAFSGYVLKADESSSLDEIERSSLMLFYTADYRSELLGLFSPEETLDVIINHYDSRRNRCLLC